MIKRRKSKPFGIRQNTRIRSPAHLKWVRGHECAVKDKSDYYCYGKAQAAHVRTGTDGALSIKPSDCYVIPLCCHHHGIQHTLGEAAFEREYQINMKKIAADLWKISPARIKMERNSG